MVQDPKRVTEPTSDVPHSSTCTCTHMILEYIAGSPFPETPLTLKFTQNTGAITVLRAVVDTNMIQRKKKAAKLGFVSSSFRGSWDS